MSNWTSSFGQAHELCFSIGNLVKVSPTDLYRQVMGLMIHEAVHLAGGDEAQASKLQELFNVYFGSRFGEMNAEAYIDDVGRKIRGSAEELVEARKMASRRIDVAHIYAKMGSVHGGLEFIQGFDDPSIFKIRFAHTSPATIDDFFKKIRDLMEDLRREFYVQRQSDRGSRAKTFAELDVDMPRIMAKSRAMSAAWKKIENEEICSRKDSIGSGPKSYRLRRICNGQEI